MYQIDPTLNPILPDQARRQDGMYNVSPDVTMLQLNMGVWEKGKVDRQYRKNLILPRLLWVRKDFTMIDLHKYVFKQLRFCFSEWIEWTNPETTRQPKKGATFDLRRMIPFPYKAADGSNITKA